MIGPGFGAAIAEKMVGTALMLAGIVAAIALIVGVIIGKSI